MSYVAIREFTPMIGKDAVLEDRILRTSDVIEKYGAVSRVGKVIGGHRAGDYELYNWYETVAAGASAMDGYSNDPDLKKIFEERALTPVAEMRGPWLGRMLHNSKSTDPRKIVLARDYHMPRKNIAKAMELVPDLQAICDENDVEMGVGVPVIASDHEMMRIIYRFKDLKHWGSATDAVIANPSFSELVDAANELGTLKHSRLIMMIK
tara:strand:- start:321 stop:944 length:624 start_codon:yes stop_codon:yes gene_type:complete